MKNRYLRIGAILSGVSLLLTLLISVVLLDTDQAIISYGLSIVNGLKFIRYITIGGVIVGVAIVLYSYMTTRQKTISAEKQESYEKINNPFYEEDDVIRKMKSNIREASPQYAKYGHQALNDLANIKDEIEDYHNITDEYDYATLRTLDNELSAMRLTIIENTKSISNRILVNNGDEEIIRRLSQNKVGIQQVKALILEAINYVDKQTPQQESDLESMIEALKELNDQV